MSQTATSWLEGALANYGSCTKKEVIDVIREYSIDDSNTIEVC